jgi:hypothetical protein
MIVEKQMKSMIEIDLMGPNGNVFYLMSTGVNFCRQLGLDKDKFLEEMKTESYEESIKVFDKYFGHFVILTR